MNAVSRKKLRILVVEDKLPTAEAVRFEFESHFSGAEIEVVRTVEAAMSKLDESCRTGNYYDIAVLDFRLPRRNIGDAPENDFSISRQFSALSSETILVHMTAFPDDQEIKRFLSNQAKFEESGHIFVAKQGDWVKEMIPKLARSLHTRRIRQRLGELFRRESTPALQRSHRRHHAIGRSDRLRTLQVATLCSDAGRHWDFLSDSLKQDLERVLGHAQDEAGNHYVGVVGPPPPTEPGQEEEAEI